MAVSKKRRLIDALREPDPPAVKRAKKAATKRASKGGKATATANSAKAAAKRKKPAPWPKGWVVGTHRCHGLTAAGTQCNRRAKPPAKMCGAHKGLTRAKVVSALKRQVRETSVNAPGERSGKDSAHSSGRKNRGTNIQEVPPERLCIKTLYANSTRERRCSNWTIEIEDGTHDEYCVTHSKVPRAKRAREKAQEKGKAGLEGRNDYRAAADKPIFNVDLKTQDDVAAGRLALMRKLESGSIGATSANVLLSALKDASGHIERYGTHQGAEGGAGVLRLLPGMKLVEMDQEIDYVLTQEDLMAIEEGLAADSKAGIPTPAEFDEIVFKYLGLKTRKRDRSRNYEGA